MLVNQEPLIERVLSAEEQKSLTPDDVLKSLVEGNKRFVAGTLTLRDHSKQIRAAVNGQFPKAIIMDHRQLEFLKVVTCRWSTSRMRL